MTNSNTWFFGLLVFCLFSGIARAEVPSAVEVQDAQELPVVMDVQDEGSLEVGQQEQSSLVGSDLEATITLAELQEILIKIDEDLEARIDDLEYGDRDEIIKILKAKKQSIIRYLTELQGFDEETVALYLLMSRRKEDDSVFWWTLGIAGVAATTVFAMASIDPETGPHWPPTFDRLSSNVNGIVDRCKKFLAPTSAAKPT